MPFVSQKRGGNAEKNKVAVVAGIGVNVSSSLTWLGCRGS